MGGLSGTGHLGMRKGAWTEEEDILLRSCIEKFGEGKWRQVPMRAGLRRCRKSCRLRWLNYLKPNLKRGEFNEDEVDLIIRLHKLLGNRWSLIAGRLPGRTANDIKNYWNSHLSKRLSVQTREKQCESKSMKTTAFKVIKPQPWSFSPNSIWLSGKRRPIIETQVQQMSNNNAGPPEEEIVSWWKNLLAEEDKEEEGKEGEMWWLRCGEGVPEEGLAQSSGVGEIKEKMSKEEGGSSVKGWFAGEWDDMHLDVDFWGLLETLQ